jgi:hypothetical protein
VIEYDDGEREMVMMMMTIPMLAGGGKRDKRK